MLERKLLKIYFCGSVNYWECKSFNESEYILLLSQYFQIKIVSAQEAEYFFVNETLNSRSDFYRHYRTDVISILIAGEAMSPDFNLYDYALGFDPITYGDRYLRFDPAFRFKKYLELKPSAVEKESEKYFCNFIYSNFLAHPVRDEIFQSINLYKRVDSLGRHLNNAGNILNKMTAASSWAQAKVDMESRYKFSISAENSFHLGYTSEKIFTAFSAGSIPIYWGNPQINHDVNSKRIINVHEFDSLKDLNDYVCYLDNDYDAYSSIVSQPWFTDFQLERTRNFPQELENFFLKIFTQNRTDASRKGDGTTSAIYVDILKLGFPIGRRLRMIQEGSNFKLVPKRVISKIQNYITRKGLFDN